MTELKGKVFILWESPVCEGLKMWGEKNQNVNIGQMFDEICDASSIKLKFLIIWRTDNHQQKKQVQIVIVWILYFRNSLKILIDKMKNANNVKVEFSRKNEQGNGLN